MIAVEKENTDIVKALLSKNADVNIQNSNFNTAFNIATGSGNADILTLLENGGAIALGV